MGALDVEPLKYHCSVSVIMPGGAAKGPCVLPVMLDSGSGMTIMKERGLQPLHET